MNDAVTSFSGTFSLFYAFKVKIMVVFFSVDFIQIALIGFLSCCDFNPGWFVDLYLAPLGLLGLWQDTCQVLLSLQMCLTVVGEQTRGFGEELPFCLAFVLA